MPSELSSAIFLKSGRCGLPGTFHLAPAFCPGSLPASGLNETHFIRFLILRDGAVVVKEDRKKIYCTSKVRLGSDVSRSVLTMNKETSIEEKILTRIPGEIIVAAFILAIPAGLIFDLVAAAVFFSGGLAAAAGFAWLRQAVTRLFLRPDKARLKRAVLVYLIRLLLISALMFIIILVSPKSILAFVAGFSVLVIVTLAEGIGAFITMRKWKV